MKVFEVLVRLYLEDEDADPKDWEWEELVGGAVDVLNSKQLSEEEVSKL
jgi:hypothetical protein